MDHIYAGHYRFTTLREREREREREILINLIDLSLSLSLPWVPDAVCCWICSYSSFVFGCLVSCVCFTNSAKWPRCRMPAWSDCALSSYDVPHFAFDKNKLRSSLYFYWYSVVLNEAADNVQDMNCIEYVLYYICIVLYYICIVLNEAADNVQEGTKRLTRFDTCRLWRVGARDSHRPFCRGTCSSNRTYIALLIEQTYVLRVHTCLSLLSSYCIYINTYSYICIHICIYIYIQNARTYEFT